jgi:hypothetical protein
MSELQLRRRLRIESGLAVASAALFAVTFVFPDWIEALTGLNPDAGSGAAEFVVSAILLLGSVWAATLARRDHRRLAIDGRPSPQDG